MIFLIDYHNIKTDIVFSYKIIAMKKSVFLICLMSLIIFSCKKDKPGINNSQNNNQNNNQTNAAFFTINGISDITMENYGGSKTLALEIKHMTDTQETVTLSASGLPGNLRDSFSTVSGIPTFYSTLTFTASGGATGTYPVKITGTTTSGGSKSYDFNVHVNMAEECSPAVTGTRTCKEDCGGGNYTVDINKVSSQDNTIMIFPLGQGDVGVTANLNCAAGTVEIPSQNPLPYLKYEGSGTFTDGKMIFHYKKTHLQSGMVTECNVVIE